MRENVGTKDRLLRSVVGPALMVSGYTKWGGKCGDTKGLVAMFAGFALIETAVTRVCPLNALLHLDTREPQLIEQDTEARVRQRNREHVEQVTQPAV